MNDRGCARKRAAAIGPSDDTVTMFSSLRSIFTRAQTQQPPVGAVPSGMRVYAVGDIHGRLDLLEELLERMAADDAGRPAADTVVIFLGDLIDRGPESAQVVERLIELGAKAADVRFLLGNHEEVFLKSMAGDEKALSFFLRIGGKPTILSYGISSEELSATDYPELLALLRQRVPQSHVEFLSEFEDMIVLGDYAFVHAGVRPGVALDLQTPAALRWIRDEFLSHPVPLEKIIVHGHTISEDVEERPHRLGIDTGAYASGRLTAMGFDGAERWRLQTGTPGTRFRA
jgi:serine/threonine protein phosphatase 1